MKAVYEPENSQKRRCPFLCQLSDASFGSLGGWKFGLEIMLLSGTLARWSLGLDQGLEGTLCDLVHSCGSKPGVYSGVMGIAHLLRHFER